MIVRLASGAAVAFVLALICAVAARLGGAAAGGQQAFRASGVALIATSGARVRLADGPRLVVFGYIGCADRCPLTLSLLARAHARAPDRVPRTTFVDCDPWFDTPRALARYVAHFPGVIGAYGDPATLNVNEAALGMRPVLGERDVAAHDARVFVLDRDGVLVGALAPDELTGDVAARIAALLAR